MILKALYDYYSLLKRRDPDLPETGYKQQEIHFVIVIDKDGNLIRVEDRMINKKEAQRFKVIADSRSSGIKPYLFYDNIEYVIGYPKDSNVEKANLRHRAFVDKCKFIAEKYPANGQFRAVVSFYEKGNENKVKECVLWDKMVAKPGANVSFMTDSCSNLVASSPDLAHEVDLSDDAQADKSICLVTGNPCVPVVLTTATMIPGSQAVAKLVSFQEKSGYDSYGKTKCHNSPISKEAESAYSTALLRLLGKNSKNKFLIGSRTFVFWANTDSEAANAVEEGIFSLFGVQEQDSDPNAKISLVRNSFMSIYSGKTPTEQEDRFYILGLAPNSARISVVYWQEISIRDFVSTILRHFEDMDIQDNNAQIRPYCGIHQMMSATTLSHKTSDVTPNLPESTIKSIFEGTPYPFSLFTAVLRRIRSELGKNEGLDRYYFKVRTAIIKAYLNRINNQYKLTTMLDTNYTNPGYVCGRLFAVMVYAQQKASGIDSIKARYMNSASTTPAAVFGTLMNLSIHHTDKLERGKSYIEKMKEDIISLLPATGFPTHLNIQDQGCFFVGYYQQTNALWSKKAVDNYAE